jgi:hypothetical protein
MRFPIVIRLVLVAAALAPASAVAQYWDESQYWEYVDTEIRLSLNYWIPGDGDFDVYDNGYGTEVQYRNWYYDPIGFGLSLGVAHWKVAGTSGDLGIGPGATLDGTVTLVPLGASVLYRFGDWDGQTLTLEAGLRYVLADSDVRINYANRSCNGEDCYDISDGLIAVFAGDYERDLTEQWAFFLGGGYQDDLIRGDTETIDRNLRDNEIKGFFMRVGAKRTLQ